MFPPPITKKILSIKMYSNSQKHMDAHHQVVSLFSTNVSFNYNLMKRNRTKRTKQVKTEPKSRKNKNNKLSYPRKNTGDGNNLENSNIFARISCLFLKKAS
jgi:hypothetical protein